MRTSDDKSTNSVVSQNSVGVEGQDVVEFRKWVMGYREEEKYAFCELVPAGSKGLQPRIFDQPGL
jgi:hypothetical protein